MIGYFAHKFPSYLLHILVEVCVVQPNPTLQEILKKEAMSIDCIQWHLTMSCFMKILIVLWNVWLDQLLGDPKKK